jgi:hypothetical protein
LAVDHPLGAVDTPSITFTGDLNTGFWSPAADTLAASTGGSERLRILSDGKVGLGTSSPGRELHISGAGTSGTQLQIQGTSASAGIKFIPSSGDNWEIQTSTANDFLIYNRTDEATRFVINGSGNVGIGTTSPGSALEINAAAATSPFIAKINTTERARIDSSGRLLVGTSTALGVSSNNGFYSLVQIRGNSAGANLEGRISLATDKASNTVVAGSDLGAVWFQDGSGGDYASIQGQGDGTAGTNDYPGRLVFSTTADGASSPTERIRITNAGDFIFKQATSPSFNVAGVALRNIGDSFFVTSGTNVIAVNRLTNDGNLMEFAQDTTVEGAISVSGTTVTYGGGHLARWSQLPNDEDPIGLLKGTVMSNLDEMCEWGEEDNEQLNKTKVSDVEGDPNVAGVFVSTSFDEDGPLDFFVAMTGDMIIRIAEGVTVQRGDLLMSAGDGTAKPQDDDVIRSKTIAKVTSTHVTCTYDDGSYCVPCVLMAC